LAFVIQKRGASPPILPMFEVCSLFSQSGAGRPIRVDHNTLRLDSPGEQAWNLTDPNHRFAHARRRTMAKKILFGVCTAAALALATDFAWATDVLAGIIQSQKQARQICPNVCKQANNMTWNGQWTCKNGRGNPCVCGCK
jgi:hypothetical protein